MNKSKLFCAALITVSCGGLASAQPTYGAFNVPGTPAVAYINGQAWSSDGKPDNRGSAAINEGAVALITYDVSLTRNYAGVAADAATCKKLEDVILKHSVSILAANFPDVAAKSLKPIPVPQPILAKVAPSNNVNVAKPMSGTTAANTKCMLKAHTPSYGGQPLELELYAAYKK